jgi:hypothetical protein
MIDLNNIWNQIGNALIVINYESLDELKKYREAIKEVGLNVHECYILAVVSNKREKKMLMEQRSVAFIAPGEIHFFRRMKNEQFRELSRRRFDLIVTIGDVSKKIVKLANRLNHKISVEINCTNFTQDVNLTTDATSPSHLINFAKQTLEKIK